MDNQAHLLSHASLDGGWPRSAAEELEWLKRRRTLLQRSIAEMRHHQIVPNLNADLMPDVGELLVWAQDELSRVERAICDMLTSGRLPSAGPPDSDAASRTVNDSRPGRRERA